MASYEKFFMGIDNGGSTTKCVIFNAFGDEVACASVSLPMLRPYPGFTERNTDELWNANCAVIRSVLKKFNRPSSDISGISVCGFGGGMGMLDSNGQSLIPFIISTDTRANNLLDEFYENGINDSVYKYTYQNLWAGQPAVLLPWVKRYKPEIIEKCAHVIMIKDYVRYRLTGEITTDPTDGSNTNLMGLLTKCFEPELFKSLGISDCARMFNQPILSACDIGGYITKQAAVQTGLTEGTPVSVGLYDVSSCCLASGILNSDILCLITGTWSINCFLTRTLADCSGKNGSTISFLPDYYMVEESSPCSASNLDWYIDQFYGKLINRTNRQSIYLHCNEVISNMDPAKSDLIFVPFLYSSNAFRGGRGAFFNLSSYHRPEDILLAVYEGIVFASCYHIEQLEGGLNISRQIRLSGGISRSSVWVQMLCDLLSSPVEVIKSSEPGALGAAICAAIASTTYKDYYEAVDNMCSVDRQYVPDPSRLQLYRSKYQRYKKAIEALQVFHKSI